MIAIEARITVTEDGRVAVDTANVPPEIAPGEHEAVIVIGAQSNSNGKRVRTELPLHDVGPWPENLSLRREDLYDD